MNGHDPERELDGLFKRVPAPEPSARLRKAIATARLAPEAARRRSLRFPRLGLGLVGLAAAALVALVTLPFLGGLGIAGGPKPIEASMVDGAYRLDFRLDKSDWSPTEAIQGTATLSYTGKESVTVGTAGDGPIGFSYTEVGGSRAISPVWAQSCVHRELAADKPISTGLTKSGGWIGEDPNASFYASFLQSGPAVYLPVGDWQITAIAQFDEGDCGGTSHGLHASLTVHVSGEGTPPPATEGPTGPLPEVSSPSVPSSIAACATEYKVKEGDTLSGIASQFSVSLADLEAVNQDAVPDPNNLVAGATLCIPASSPPSGSTAISGRFVSTGSYLSQGSPARAFARLTDGRVLFVDDPGAEIYDPGTGTFSEVGDPTVSHPNGTATLLADGRVLLADGFLMTNGETDSAELFDPATSSFSKTGSTTVPRFGSTATLLGDGRVLIAGGGLEHSGVGWLYRGQAMDPRPLPSNDRLADSTLEMLSSAELYDPATGTFQPTGPMTTGRDNATATLLGDGRVLIAGGGDEGNSGEQTAELYDPRTGSFTPTGSMHEGRYSHQATLLPDGNVLITGGTYGTDGLTTIESYDSALGTFIRIGDTGGRNYYSVVPMPDGRVLLMGGLPSKDAVKTPSQLQTDSVVFDPQSRTFSPGPAMASGNIVAAVPLVDGRAVVVEAPQGIVVELYEP